MKRKSKIRCWQFDARCILPSHITLHFSWCNEPW